MAEAGEATDVRDIQVFTQKGLFARRIMDEINYDDDLPWPVGADGTGFTLAKVHEDTATDNPSNWGVSQLIGGSPGAANAGGNTDELQTLVDADAFCLNDRPSSCLVLQNYAHSRGHFLVQRLRLKWTESIFLPHYLFAYQSQ